MSTPVLFPLSLATIPQDDRATYEMLQRGDSIGTFQVAGLDPDGAPQPKMTGCHQPSERFNGTIVPCAWFASGLRILDIADPFAPREVASYVPDPPNGCERASSNDVTIDDRGLLYLVDRQGGVDILETTVW